MYVYRYIYGLPVRAVVQRSRSSSFNPGVCRKAQWNPTFWSASA